MCMSQKNNAMAEIEKEPERTKKIVEIIFAYGYLKMPQKKIRHFQRVSENIKSFLACTQK